MAKQMTVVKVEPGKAPRVVEIGNELAAIQKAVGGYIQGVYSSRLPEAVILCNEDGKNMGLPRNRYLTDVFGEPYDVLVGTFLVVGTKGEEFCDLSRVQIEKAVEVFKEVPRFESAVKRWNYRRGCWE